MNRALAYMELSINFSDSNKKHILTCSEYSCTNDSSVLISLFVFSFWANNFVRLYISLCVLKYDYCICIEGRSTHKLMLHWLIIYRLCTSSRYIRVHIPQGRGRKPCCRAPCSDNYHTCSDIQDHEIRHHILFNE